MILGIIGQFKLDPNRLAYLFITTKKNKKSKIKGFYLLYFLFIFHFFFIFKNI